MEDEELLFSRSGMVARSPEGHAAKGMHIKGDETAWIDIQNNTFKNWVNEQLRVLGLQVNDLQTDFGDGLKLIGLVEVLQKRKLPKIKKPMNQHQYLENVQTALNAIAADGVKLVNIGNTDIVEGNLKLILGLIWSLILRYQIGRTKFPPKKLMLAWLRAVLPDCKVTNFTRDWNSGHNLSALVDYCKPGLFPHWRKLDARDSINNCRNAMQLAKQEFGIPMVLQPEYLASQNLDELSGMTYLSYFMKEDSPGYWATLNWVRKQVPELNVRNFTTDWNDGITLCSLARQLGGSVPGFSKLTTEQSHWESNLQLGIDAGKRLGVEPVLKAKSMADPEVEHLGPMAYVAQYQWIKPRKRPWETITVTSDLKSVRVHNTATFRIDFHNEEVNIKEITIDVRGPNGKVDCKTNFNKHGGTGNFVPYEVGMHQILVHCEGEPVQGCPVNIRVLPDLSKIQFAGIDPCAIGSIVEVLINSKGAGVGGLLEVEAVSPSGHSRMCPVSEEDGIFSTTFQPDEAGEWKIAILYEEEHINGSPFTCYCYDPHAVRVLGLDGAMTGQPFMFTVDTSSAGWGDIKLDIAHNGRSVHHKMEEVGSGLYRIHFTPLNDGKHKIYVYFNGIEVKGSPFRLKVTPTLDPSNVTAMGDGLKMVHVGRLAKFDINCRGAGTGDVDIQIVGPSRKSTIPVRLTAHRDGTISVEYTAIEVGEHIIEARICGVPIRNSPFRVQACDPRQVKVSRIPDGFAGKPVEFEVDSSHAGQGNLEVVVNEGHVTSTVKSVGKQHYVASFTPLKSMSYSIDVTFNQQPVPGSPFKCNVAENTPNHVTVSGESLEAFSTGKTASFDVYAPGFQKDDLKVTITGPSKKTLHHSITDLHKHMYRVDFIGQEVGIYTIEVSVAGKKIPGSPFVTKAYNAELIRVSQVPNGVVGQTVQFQVDASQAGEGQLEISVNDGEVPNHVEVLGGGRCLVSFTPELPKMHVIDIKFNGETVPGCPLRCKVNEFIRASLDLQSLELIPINRPSRFDVDIEGGREADLHVNVTSPTNTNIPVKINGSARNGFIAEFIPREVGPHTIYAEYGAMSVSGTPFTCKVYDSQKVSVGEIPQGMLGKSTQFVVDASQAGEGNLEITVSAQGQNIPTEVRPLGNARFAIAFVPIEAVDHVIDISFNKESVTGSPFRAKIQDVSKVASKIFVSSHKELITSVHEHCSLTVTNVSGTADDIEVKVEGPDGFTMPAHIRENGDQTFTIEFSPRLTGDYKIYVTFCKVQIPGSPFHCRVYDAKQIKVRDIPRGSVGKPVTFLVETINAGPGNLEVTVNNGHVPSSAQAQDNQVYAITFTPKEAKQHIIDIKFNGEHVPGSPFRCVVTDMSRIEITGDGLDKVPIGKTATFTVNPRGTQMEDLDVKIASPTRRPVSAAITPTAGNTYLVKYVPSEVGDHIVEVLYGNSQVPGSPFLVKAYDSTKVRVTDINSGSIGKPVYFSIDASQAGAGNLEIIVSVNGKNVPNYVQSEGNAKFRVNFRPQDPHPHQIKIKFNGEAVPGSPFSVHVADSVSQVQILGNSLTTAAISKYTSFTIDTMSSVTSECSVTIIGPSGHSTPAKISGGVGGRYEVEFSPSEVGPHLIHISVDNKQIQGSPFTCNVYDINKIQVTGLEPGIMGKPITFTVDASQAGEGTLELVITTRKTSVRAEVSARSRGLYDVTFVPHEATPHFVNVSFNEQEVPGSPYWCEIVESKQEQVALLRSENYNNHDSFLSSMSTTERQKWKKEMTYESSHHKSSHHVDHVISNGPTTNSFNNNHINYERDERDNRLEKSKFFESSTEWKLIQHSSFSEIHNIYAKGDGLSSHQAIAGSTASFEINAKGLDGDLDIRITGPNEMNIPAKVVRLKNNIYRVEYHMPLAGLYRIEAYHSGTAVFKHPFSVEVCDPNRVTVRSVSDGIVGKESTFTVDTSRAGKGNLSVLIRAAGKEVINRVDDLAGGIHEVIFTPRTPTVHRIDIRYNGQHIPGSPQEINVRDPATGRAIIATGVGLHQAKAMKTTSFIIETLGCEAKDFDVIVTGPNETLIPVQCYLQKDGNLVAKFIPQQAGPHTIEVHYNGKPIKGSPFVCQVYDASKVIIEEITTTEYSVNEKISFRLNRRHAGYSELDVTITSPLGKNLPIEVRGTADGEGELIEFIPTVPGKYKISILYGGEEVLGSPVIFTVEDDGVPRVFGEGLIIGYQDQPTVFRIDARGMRGEPHVQVDGPDTVARCSIEEEEDGIFVVTYVPQEVGVFDVRVMWNGREVPGSPFHARIINIRKVSAIGGWDSLLGNQNRLHIHPREEKKITVDISQAGPGMLTAEVQGPRGSVKSNVESIGNHRCTVTFTPHEIGDHFLHLYFAGVPLPKSPYLCVVEHTAAQIDHSKVILRGLGLASAHVGDRAEFTIDGSDAGPGSPEVSMTGVKADIHVEVTNIGNNVYKASYIPTIGGAYLLNVLWSGRQVRGCPLKVNITSNTDPSKVICTGDGLKGGALGKEIKTFIDTRKAGPGELSTHCIGPHKVAYCELYDHQDGTFTLHVKPQEAGRHTLTVKYGGEHIPGSPFTLKIAGAPDASKVRVYGPGIEPGVLANYQSRFICETKGAGAGQLTVRIRGPKGAFRVEMQRESQKDRTILCKYDPTEPGDYRIEVKWSGEHVPGSPFTVMIFDTQEELNRYLQGHFNANLNNSDYFGPQSYGTAYSQLSFGQMSWRGSQAQL